MKPFLNLKPGFLLSLVSLELTYNRIDIAHVGRSSLRQKTMESKE